MFLHTTYTVRLLNRLVLLIAATQIITNATAQEPGIWTDPQPLNSYHNIDQRPVNDLYPVVAADNAGNWLTAWDGPYLITESRDQGYLNPTFSFSRSTDGQTWVEQGSITQPGSARIKESNLTAVGDQQFLFSWISDTIASGTRVSIARTTDTGATWSSPLHINAANARQMNIAADNAGNALAYWIETRTTNVVVLSKSTDSGITWTSPTVAALGTDAAPVALAVTATASGTWEMVFLAEELVPVTVPGQDPLLFKYNFVSFASSQDLGNSWQFRDNVSAVAADFYPMTKGHVVIEAHQDQVVAGIQTLSFYDGNQQQDGGMALYRRSDSQTTYTYIRSLPSSKFDQYNVLAHDSSGNWAALTTDMEMWQSTNLIDWTLAPLPFPYTEIQRPQMAGANGKMVAVAEHYDMRPFAPHAIDTDWDIKAALTSDGWDTASPLSDVKPDSFTDGSQVFDSIPVLTAAGNTIIAVWKASPLNHGNPSFVVARSADGGRTWSEATFIDRMDASGQDVVFEHEAIYLQNNRWIIVWHFTRGSYQYAFSTDDGQTWGEVQRENDVGILGHWRIASNGHGQLMRMQTGNIGARPTRFHYSPDGGVTWTSEVYLSPVLFNFLRHVQGSTWIAVEDNGTVHRTINNGGTWAPVSAIPESFDVLETDNQGHLVAARSVVAQSGKNAETTTVVYTSTDAGQTWAGPDVIQQYVAPANSVVGTYSVKPALLYSGDSRWNLFLRHTGPHFRATSSNNGQTFRAPAAENNLGETFASNGSYLVSAHAAPDLRFGTILTESDIYFQILAPELQSGATDWQLFE